MRALSFTRIGQAGRANQPSAAGNLTMTPELDRILRTAGEAADDAVDLGETALALGAADMPELVLDPYREHLARLARDVGARGGEGGAGAQARALADVLAGEYGYDGDRVTYDNMANANLVRVIDRRRGLPVALGILYIHAGRANGWRVSGVNFPGHFLVRLNGDIAGGPPPVLIDPFSGGRIMDEDALQSLLARVRGLDDEAAPLPAAELADFLRPVSARAVLLRLQNNMYTRALEARDTARGASILARMTAIAPRDPALWLERGRLDGELGSLLGARRAFARAAELALAEGRTQLAREARQLADRLKKSLN